MPAKEKIISIIIDIVANELNVKPDSLNEEVTFHELGLDSVNSIFLISEVELKLNIDIDPMSVYDNPTISSFSDYIYKLGDGAN